MSLKKTTLTYIILSIFAMTNAKPVHVSEVLLKKGKLSASITTSYINLKKINSIVLPTEFQTKNGDFITIPTYIGNKYIREDYVDGLLTIKYGFSDKFEIYGAIDMFASNITANINNSVTSEKNTGINTAYIGLRYQIKQENDTPALLVGISSDFYSKEKIRKKTYVNHFESYRISVNTFYTIDPIVFSLKASYGINLPKEFDKQNIVIGNMLTIAPEIYFAVNPSISFNWGLKYHYHGKSTINKQIRSSYSEISYTAGVSYALSSVDTIGLQVEVSNIPSKAKNTISMTISHKF